MLWMSHQKTLAEKSVCAALITSVIEPTLSWPKAAVLVELCWFSEVTHLLCYPRNGCQKLFLHYLLWERYLVRMTALQFPAPCFDDGCDICFFPKTGNPIWLPQPLEGDRKQHNEVTHLPQHLCKQLLFSRVKMWFAAFAEVSFSKPGQTRHRALWTLRADLASKEQGKRLWASQPFHSSLSLVTRPSISRAAWVLGMLAF